MKSAWLKATDSGMCWRYLGPRVDKEERLYPFDSDKKERKRGRSGILWEKNKGGYEMKSKVMVLVGMVIVVVVGCVTVWSVEKLVQAEFVMEEGEMEECVLAGIVLSRNDVERVGWKEGIGEWKRKGRPYRNPERKYRLGKKARVRLRGCLARLDALERLGSTVGKGKLNEGTEVGIGMNVVPERWG